MKTYHTTTGAEYRMAQGKHNLWFGFINFAGHASHFATITTDEDEAKQVVEDIVRTRNEHKQEA
jgi:hypothetical protein